MACDTRLKPRQTISERAKEIREALERLTAAIMAGRVKIIIDRATRAVAFQGWDGSSRDGVTDGCAYRAILRNAPAKVRMAIAAAEQMAGVTIDKKTVAQGTHSHDGGQTWHSHKH